MHFAAVVERDVSIDSIHSQRVARSGEPESSVGLLLGLLSASLPVGCIGIVDKHV